MDYKSSKFTRVSSTSKDDNFLNKWGIYILAFLFLVSIGFNIWQMYKGCKESFCTCQGAVSKYCPNPKVLTDLYEDGTLTENSKLIKGNTWESPMPYDSFSKSHSTGNNNWIDPMPYDIYEQQQFNIR